MILKSHDILVHSFDLNIFGDGAILGCDFVGTVEELGSEVSRIAKGDVVAGLIWGGKCPSHDIKFRSNSIAGEIKGIGGTVNTPLQTSVFVSRSLRGSHPSRPQLFHSQPRPLGWHYSRRIV